MAKLRIRQQTASDTRRLAVREWLDEIDNDILLADGFDEAIIGLGRRCGQPDIVVYSYQKCVAILMRDNGLTQDEAEEYLELNTVGAWVGERTPIFVTEYGHR